jgi:uncharacterized hydrophobic protein (TIGR00341 family)
MKKIEIYADVGHVDTVKGIVEQYEIRDFWPGAENEEGRISMRLLVDDDTRQVVMDALQAALGGSETTRMVISPVEAVLPKPSDDGDSEEKRKKSGTLTREELYNSIEKNAELTNTYLLLVGLSTFVVAIGLLADNVAVVIAAMVIAPLLGPNLALSFSTSLGDTELVWKSLKTLIAGLLLAFIISLVIGYFWQKGFESRELLDRTRVNLASVALALASGYAAVLSMVTGLSQDRQPWHWERVFCLQ